MPKSEITASSRRQAAPLARRPDVRAALSACAATCASSPRTSASPLSVMPTSTTRRSWRLRLRFTSPRRFQAVDQARDVRVALNHPLRDVAARQPGRMGAAEDPEHVVLVGGQLGRRLEKSRPRLHDPCGRHPQAEQDFLLGGREGLLLLQLVGDDASHAAGQYAFTRLSSRGFIPESPSRAAEPADRSSVHPILLL